MRVVTWNVQTGRPNPDGPADVDRVVEHLRRLDGDVVALQELDRARRRSGGVDQPGVIADALGATLLWAPTVRRGRGEYGIAILVVRGDVAHHRVVDLGGTREPRALVVAEVDQDGRRWAFGATHLSRRHRCAATQLTRCLDELSSRPEPRVLVGDLNLEPRRVLPWSTGSGFHLVEGPPTHSTRRRHPRHRIDHLLVSGAEVERAAVHRFDVSDHCAVTATLG